MILWILFILEPNNGNECTENKTEMSPKSLNACEVKYSIIHEGMTDSLLDLFHLFHFLVFIGDSS